MSSFSPALPTDRVDEVLDLALRNCPADGVEVTVLGRTGEYTRFAGERVHQPQDITELSLFVKAIVDGHIGRAATSSPARLADTARSAAEMARARAAAVGKPGAATIAEPDDSSEPTTWHDDTAGFDAAERNLLAGKAILAAADAGGSAAGMIGRALTQQAVANSNGVRRHALATEASGSLTVTIDDGTAHWADLHRSSGALAAAASIAATVERALRGRGRIALPDGEHTVVLGPQAVGELLGFLEAIGFSGELAAAGVGVCAQRPGEQLVSELVNVADDALADVGLPLGFDFEGTTRRTVPFFTKGVVGEPVTDLATAAQLGRPSTGHAHIAREEVPSPVAANIVMAAGDSAERDLIAGVERGVYVERFWYTRLVDRQAATITGVSRDGCFLIEDGELATPVDTARFTQSVLGLLATVDAVGDSLHSLPVMNVWNGCVTAPAVRGHGFRFGARPVDKETK
jgi:PmbA protein